MELLAWSAVESGRCERAAWLLGATRTIWDRIGCALFGIEMLLAQSRSAAVAAREALGDAAYEKSRARGRRWTPRRRSRTRSRTWTCSPNHRSAPGVGERGARRRAGRPRIRERPPGTAA
ncbi:hypothetical protein NKH77_49535 [Streptomyces sp. M19]